jgi:arylsulfatase A-like enzyme
MSRTRLAALALLAPLLVPGCDDSNPAPAAPRADAGQKRERIEITRTYPRESPADDVRNSRASLTRILTAQNDALTAPFPGRLQLDLPPSGADSFAGALCLVGLPEGRTPPRVRLYFEIDFVGPQGTPEDTRKHSVTLGFSEAVSGWAPMQFVRGGLDATKLTIRGSYIGEDVPTDLPNLRMCLAVPGNEVLGKPDEKTPNVLVISVDTLRPDHLSCYGYERKTSPAIDALVARGALFERAYSSAPWTLPSYGSLFTGMLPADHRAGIVREREEAWGRDVAPEKRTTEVLRGDVPTLAELLAKRGYQTAGFVSNPFLAPAAGVARGFQSYTCYQYNAQTGVDLALEWINARPASRWFVFLHLIDPHMPYAAPKPYDTRFTTRGIDDLKDWPPDLDTMRRTPPSDEVKQACIDHYDGEIAFVDAQIERLLESLSERGTLNDTLIVLHSDHGEEFWEHGSCDHGHTQYDELLRVPFALVWPGHVPAKRVATRVRALDLLPTVAELAGFAAPAGIEGKSLLPVLDGRETADRDGIAEALMHSDRETKAVFVGTDKLIATGTATNLLFELGADPAEKNDRASGAAALVESLRKKLVDHQTAARAAAAKAEQLRLDAASRHRIENYGYAGGGEPPKKKSPQPPQQAAPKKP